MVWKLNSTTKLKVYKYVHMEERYVVYILILKEKPRWRMYVLEMNYNLNISKSQDKIHVCGHHHARNPSLSPFFLARRINPCLCLASAPIDLQNSVITWKTFERNRGIQKDYPEKQLKEIEEFNKIITTVGILFIHNSENCLV